MPSSQRGLMMISNLRPWRTGRISSWRAPRTTMTGLQPEARAVRAAWRSMGWPRKSSNCLGEPMRVELPAARRMRADRGDGSGWVKSVIDSKLVSRAGWFGVEFWRRPSFLELRSRSSNVTMTGGDCSGPARDRTRCRPRGRIRVGHVKDHDDQQHKMKTLV
jgi:hypothetical protein